MRRRWCGALVAALLVVAIGPFAPARAASRHVDIYLPTCTGFAAKPPTWTPYCSDQAWVFADIVWDTWTEDGATAHAVLSWHVGASGPHGELPATLTLPFAAQEADNDPRESYSSVIVDYYGQPGPNGEGPDLIELDETEMLHGLRSSPVVLPECTAPQLRGTFDDEPYGFAAGGNQETDYSLLNVSSSSCELIGFPGIAVTTHGRAVPLRFHWGDWPGTSWGLTVHHWPVLRVDLAPGSSARFATTRYRCDGGYRTPAERVAVYPPDSPDQVPLDNSFVVCVNAQGRGAQTDPGNDIWVSPVQPPFPADR